MILRCIPWLLYGMAVTPSCEVPSALDLKLMKEVTVNLGENHAISPFVMSTLMSQVWLATNGSTRDEITPVLGVTQPAPLSFLTAYKSAISYLSSSSASSQLTTSVFNRMYVRSGFSVRPTFTNYLTAYYGNTVGTFSTPAQGVTLINGDVAAATEDRIQDLVQTSHLRFAEVVLVSAMYFKGVWKQTFPPAAPGTFLTGNGEKQVNMMKLNLTELQYANMGTYDVVALPYTDEDYCMLLIRPLERSMSAATALRNSLGTLSVNSIVQQLVGQPVYVTLPRFKIESDYSLVDDMQQLGIKQIFSAGADFSSLTDDWQGLFVTAILHKVFIEVNENGTEAAGAGAVIIGRGNPPADFKADRPFFAVVYNKQHKINMFTAYVGDPTQA
ncbi:Neuroserpin [Amphibalanus amphitrite]|uniref:Neuroserpin n=1 Tax=Amphibalanus amphitrite TaxID=1232801 RepID=A0A6A4V9S0_AMPAM|nr:Neuroserpin [Amphibalanus amphitrite]